MGYHEKVAEESDVTVQEVLDLLVDVQSVYSEANKAKDKTVMLLIICMCVQAIVFFGGFVYYESQFDYVTTTEDGVEISTEGENANAEYNDVKGNQYNDNATHNDTKGSDK